jgi:hypothetical protein
MITVGVRCLAGSLRSRRQISSQFMPGNSKSGRTNEGGFLRSNEAFSPSSPVNTERVLKPCLFQRVAKHFLYIGFVFYD